MTIEFSYPGGRPGERAESERREGESDEDHRRRVGSYAYAVHQVFEERDRDREDERERLEGLAASVRPFEDEEEEDDEEDEPERFIPHNASVYFAAYDGAVAGIAIQGVVHRRDPEHYLRQGLIGIAGAFARAADRAWHRAERHDHPRDERRRDVDPDPGPEVVGDLDDPTASALNALTQIVQNNFTNRSPSTTFDRKLFSARFWRHNARALVAVARASQIYETFRVHRLSGDPVRMFAANGVLPSAANDMPVLIPPLAESTPFGVGTGIPGITVLYNFPRARPGDVLVMQFVNPTPLGDIILAHSQVGQILPNGDGEVWAEFVNVGLAPYDITDVPFNMIAFRTTG